ncbi:ATP-binding protein [Chitinilyticum litopenaei]|uniref:ATP-binding protein n=1 Tax=Chitinilyticum litopenaei TaxID=1121276 RepID=UPI001FE03BC4|nr:ATP-binding protein [Chitinilyticum litopenaei]
MPTPDRLPRGLGWLGRFWPDSLYGRLVLVMLAGVLGTQLLVSALWAKQVRLTAETENRAAAQHIGFSAASALRFFRSLPANYRSLMLEQLHEMGGTRFFINVNREPVFLPFRIEQPLATLVTSEVAASLRRELPPNTQFQIAFAPLESLPVSDDRVTVQDLPDSWVQHTLVVRPRPAPVLVIQAEIEPGNWLYLATLMPDPYFLDNNNALTLDRIVLQGLTLASVLLLSLLVVRWLTRPLAALADAAEAFGKGDAPVLPATGSREYVRTARAFGAMQERIQRYLDDREKLFAAISHDLRTPITRLKLRAEMLDDDEVRREFHEDLDELDVMVKGALQTVKDSDIHENRTRVSLDALLGRLVRDAQLAGLAASYTPCLLTVQAKPLALKRALSNLLDNGLKYGGQVEIRVDEGVGKVVISLRDHGPGVPEEQIERLFQPYVRLDHGRQSNQGGMGLGLGIARSIIQAHGGTLELSNHPQGGLLVQIMLPS